MIKFEHNMLVLSGIMTKEDVNAINDFAEYVRNQEQKRITKLFEESDSACKGWAIALINGEQNAQRQTQEIHPPKRFRDIANAE